jgi:hypothetical protein
MLPTKRRKSEFKRTGLDPIQIIRLNHLVIVSRDYKNANSKHGNTSSIAWKHFGFLAVWDKSVSDTNAFKTKESCHTNTNLENENTSASISLSDSDPAVVGSIADRLVDGQRVVNDKFYWCG